MLSAFNFNNAVYVVRQCSVTKICANAGIIPSETFKFMKRDPNKRECRKIVFNRHRWFKDGREELEDSSRVCRPTFSDRNVHNVTHKVADGRRRMIDENASSTAFSHETVH